VPHERLSYEKSSTLFARQDTVEEAWRIVDPVLKERMRPWSPLQGPDVSGGMLSRARLMAD
jgi:glucose-6-phosphate 1-dehydrogenase